MNIDTSPTHALTLGRLSEVKARTGLSRSEIYRQVASGSFPKPVKLGQRASAWVLSEVDRWIQNRIQTRDSKEAESVQKHASSIRGGV
jgi:prophage regulatory protein